MERKRKLPARAAARGEHVAKKRNITPPVDSSIKSRSQTPQASAGSIAENAPPEPQQSLPKCIQPGKPLPTVEEPQPQDLSNKEFQSVSESGVLAESLSRSRQKWTDGLFEKYWTKPSKKKGAVEDPKNPLKETMQKLGLVTITVEPHVFEATMFIVKDPRPDTPAPPSRPYLQYGPPNGNIPPSTPKSSTSGTSGPSAARAKEPSKASEPPTPIEDVKMKIKVEPDSDQSTQAAAILAPASKPVPSALGKDSALLPPATSAAPAPQPAASSSCTTTSAISISRFTSPAGQDSPRLAPPTGTPTSASARPAVSRRDPIIASLAEKANSDDALRELMKRVAVGTAAKDDIARFQGLINRITLEHKTKSLPQGPPPESLTVDGRTVKYFSSEVSHIVQIVLRSNPKQRGVDLKAPTGSDPLVVGLVRKSLDDFVLLDKIKRVAEGTQLSSDATDIQSVLENLEDALVKEKEAASRPNQSLAPPPPASSSSQALRSKGPPPPPPIRRDISSVVLEFAGGRGDRYLFPKFAILEAQNNGQQVIASFLIVRKGSDSEYGGDPALDYYQPVTIRIFGHTSKHLEALQKVVAPREDVQRYMEDVMDNMTRSEYVLLAMRLPSKEEKKEGERGSSTETGGTATNSNNGNCASASAASGGVNTPKSEPGGLVPGGPAIIHQSTPPAVLWKATPPPLRPSPVVRRAINAVGGDGNYQHFVSKIASKRTEEVL